MDWLTNWLDWLTNSLTYLLETPWAYVILLVWTFLEGETIVIFAGIAAQDGKPWLPMVILCSFAGSLCSDQLMFFLGRYKGQRFVAKRPWCQLRMEKVYRMLERHQYWLILGFRFLYGLRNITPIALGMSNVRTKVFVALNVLGAAVWATAFACGGYIFGMAMATYFEEKRHKVTFMVCLLALVMVIWIVRKVHLRYKLRRQAAAILTQPTVPSDPAASQASDS